MKKYLMLAAVVGLAACSENKQDDAAQLDCSNPNIAVNFQQQLLQTIGKEARYFANNDARQFVDADKVIAAAGSMQIKVEGFQPNTQQTACVAQTSISVPNEILQRSVENAPLLNMDNPVTMLIQRLSGGNMRFDGQTLNFPLNYSVKSQNGQTEIVYDESNISNSGNALSNVLLPYGVKDMLMVNGQAMRREDALRLALNPRTVVASAPEVKTVREVAPLGDQVSNNTDDLATFAQEAVTRNEQREANARAIQQKTEVLEPNDEVEESNISAGELADARKAHSSADQSLKSQWRKIDPEVQKDLIDEQKSWENQKNQSCRKAANKGRDGNESLYLQMQCDTRMTRERVQYLRGYSIQ